MNFKHIFHNISVFAPAVLLCFIYYCLGNISANMIYILYNNISHRDMNFFSTTGIIGGCFGLLYFLFVTNVLKITKINLKTDIFTDDCNCDICLEYDVIAI
jgi:hypothetical protein